MVARWWRDGDGDGDGDDDDGGDEQTHIRTCVHAHAHGHEHEHAHTPQPHTLIEKGNWISHTGVNPPQSQPKVILFVGPVLPTTPLLETVVFLTVHLVHSFFEILPGLDQ